MVELEVEGQVKIHKMHYESESANAALGVLLLAVESVKKYLSMVAGDGAIILWRQKPVIRYDDGIFHTHCRFATIPQLPKEVLVFLNTVEECCPGVWIDATRQDPPTDVSLAFEEYLLRVDEETNLESGNG